MSKRIVTFSDFFKILKSKGPVTLIGLGVIIFFSCIMLPLMILVVNKIKTSKLAVDYEKVELLGIQKKAQITNIVELNNVTINQNHPLVITYQFENAGQLNTDSYATMDFDAVANFKVGNEVDIKTYANNSKILGVEPFNFPYYLFYLIPIIFSGIGFIMFLIGLIPSIKRYRLYKNGNMMDATIVSFSQKSGLPVTRIGKNTRIDYCFLNANGQKIMASAKPSNLAIFNEKDINDQIKILVSPTNENNSCILPMDVALKNRWEIN